MTHPTEELRRVKLAKEIDGLESVIFVCEMVSGSRRSQGDGVRTNTAMSAMVNLAGEVDESARDAVVYGMVR